MIETARTDQQRVQFEQLFQEWRYPSVQPLSDQLIIDLSGNVWVRHFQLRPRDVARWTVFDSAGSWLGEVAAPGALTVKEIGEEYMLGLWNDELGVEYVRLYAIEK
jgi:streptogramin lyase